MKSNDIGFSENDLDLSTQQRYEKDMKTIEN